MNVASANQIGRTVRALFQTVLWAATVVFGLFLVLLLLFVLMCATGEKPGEGPEAAAGYRWGEPIVAALETYHRDHGRYPDSLSVLTPRYVAKEVLTLPPPVAGPGYQLDRRGGYSLSFFYTGPASNTCTYTPAKRRWTVPARGSREGHLQTFE